MNERVAVDREGRPLGDRDPARDRDPRSVMDREPAGSTMEREPRPANVDTRAVAAGDRPMSLFHDEEGRGFHTRWDAIQTGFVDQPKAAVEQADALVSEMLKRLTDGFGAEREKLESQWRRGQDVSTEDLRVALKRYRSFFERLLSI
jgi:hypothetical protein